MGIFSKKPDSKPNETPEAQAEVVANQIFDENYKQELHELGKRHFQKLIEEQSSEIPKMVTQITETITSEMKSYITTQLDLTLSKLSKDFADKLNQQTTAFQQSSDQAQELVSQSLNRNSQAIYAKYQQMVTDLQHVISDQEMMMVGVFQDNKSKVLEVQTEQDKAMRELSATMSATKQQAEQISGQLKNLVDSQSSQFESVYRDNIGRLEQIHKSQEVSLSTLTSSSEAVVKQHEQLAKLMDNAIEKQKALISDTINQHMSKIIEHYLIASLGESSDVVAQLPAILDKLEENKQAMQEDMKL